MNAKPLQHGSDDTLALKFKDFQRSLTSNSKNFRTNCILKNFSGHSFMHSFICSASNTYSKHIIT